MKSQIVFFVLVVYFLRTNGNKGTVFKLSDKSEQDNFYRFYYLSANHIYLDYHECQKCFELLDPN